jgi:hypothetical protein
MFASVLIAASLYWLVEPYRVLASQALVNGNSIPIMEGVILTTQGCSRARQASDPEPEGLPTPVLAKNKPQLALFQHIRGSMRTIAILRHLRM